MTKDILSRRVGDLLNRRQREGSLRRLQDLSRQTPAFIDFASNDYLGLAQNAAHIEQVAQAAAAWHRLGATGSRLLTGENWLAQTLETEIADFHASPAALLFNSGYDANIGWLPALARRGDVVLYDADIHASLHDAMRMTATQAAAFAHNDSQDLGRQLADLRHNADFGGVIFVLVESVYSMNGDLAPLAEMVELCQTYDAILFVDEAHGTGTIGKNGEGLVQKLGLASQVPLRLHTFGKALGAHGAALLCSDELRQYFINYARSLIYTTAMPAHSLFAVRQAYQYLQTAEARQNIQILQQNIAYFGQKSAHFALITPQPSAIQFIPVANNADARALAARLFAQRVDARAILAPTVPQGSQRLRICLHSYNTPAEIDALFELLANE
jgi:8-amino-7-oxononanoate synthase